MTDDDLPPFDFVDDVLPEKRFIDAADLLLRPFEPPRFRVRHLFPESGAIVLFTGDTGAGKTAFLFHSSVCVAVDVPVAGRFEVTADDRPVLYVNGEMSQELLVRYLHEALAGLDRADIPPGRILFEGNDGIAKLRFSDADSRRVFEDLIEEKRPSLVVLDTQRAILGINERDDLEIRDAYEYLHRLAIRYEMTVIVAHHVRKLGDVSNSARERVSGHRDLIAKADVHIALRSTNGHPASGIYIDKTRFACDGVAAGTEFALESRLMPGAPGGPLRSIFIAADRATPAEIADKLDETKAEIIALVEAQGPMTLEALNARTGNRKRAHQALCKDGSLVECGKDGRKTLYGTPAQAETIIANGVNESDPVDPTREKPLRHKGLNGVKPDPTRDRAGRTGGESGTRRRKAGTDSRRPQNERGPGSSIYRDPDPGPHSQTRPETVEEKPPRPRSLPSVGKIPARRADATPCGFPIGAAGDDCARCGCPSAEHAL